MVTPPSLLTDTLLAAMNHLHLSVPLLQQPVTGISQLLMKTVTMTLIHSYKVNPNTTEQAKQQKGHQQHQYNHTYL